MSVKKILVSQPKPSSEKSPYYDIASKYGVEIVFRPFIKVEGLSSKEFRQQKISIADFSAIIFSTLRTARRLGKKISISEIFTPDDFIKFHSASDILAGFVA